MKAVIILIGLLFIMAAAFAAPHHGGDPQYDPHYDHHYDPHHDHHYDHHYDPHFDLNLHHHY